MNDCRVFTLWSAKSIGFNSVSREWRRYIPHKYFSFVWKHYLVAILVDYGSCFDRNDMYPVGCDEMVAQDEGMKVYKKAKRQQALL